MTEHIEQRPVGKQINNNYDIVIVGSGLVGASSVSYTHLRAHET